MWAELDKYRTQYLNLNLQNALDYEKFCMISIVYHSTKIEGCSLTETDTKVLLDKGITAKGKPLKDHLMVKDHYAAFLWMQEQANIKRKFSIEFLQETCAVLMKNTGEIVNTATGSFDTSKGELRLAPVYVDKKYFPDFRKVPGLLQQLSDNVNQRIDAVSDENEILKLAADLHYNLVNIHPFGDGNGRLSRLFMNYVLMYHHQPFVKIFTEDRTEYIDALNETEEKQDPEIFRTFIAIQQLKFFKIEIEKFSKSGQGFDLLF
ncbi:MAG: cell filamentation protein Fic [Bacteroidetes bacterium GWF2_43_63]|nr:MAG: cell filamentation protein Fic [Bacteroidetes bacterium GWE2_42_42]OFY53918.1 MAG: cell filamentation protein Fic [Bacteroidetes bacterium GWF2_43_63]HBG69299.1 Fic family protein [Bacteroidales bacterium]HCB60353.1 Fic family protein [Bacteroidales bacterium]HCY23660.1 Fic family protein [Bacteroidales bacterium]